MSKDLTARRMKACHILKVYSHFDFTFLLYIIKDYCPHSVYSCKFILEYSAVFNYIPVCVMCKTAQNDSAQKLIRPMINNLLTSTNSWNFTDSALKSMVKKQNK